MRIAIVGGVAAGMSAASQAKQAAPGAEVVVFERGQDVSYGACGMPYNLADPARGMDDLVVISAETFRRERGLDVRLGHAVTGLEPEAHRLTVSGPDGVSRSEPYDRLVLATGAQPVRPTWPGIDLPGVHVLRSLEDGRRLKAALGSAPAARVAIIGGGYIGLELAEALRLGWDSAVTVIEAQERLVAFAPAAIGQRVAQTLAANGVALLLATPVQELRPLPGAAIGVRTPAGSVTADLVVLALGVRPASALAQAAGLRLGPQGAIAVDAELRTSAPDVWAAGDCADAQHLVTGQPVWLPLALRANRAGRLAGANAAGAHLAAPPVAGTAVFRVFDLELATTGLGLEAARAAGFDAQAELTTTRSVAHAFPGNSPFQVNLVAERGSGRLLGAQLCCAHGAAHRIDAVATALAARMTVAEFEALDLAYAPPFGPAWDPLLIAARMLQRRL